MKPIDTTRITEVVELEELVRDLAMELKHVEWIMGRCPVCVNRDKIGHSDDCSLSAALSRVPKELKP
jgi:hypothetical protein